MGWLENEVRNAIEGVLADLSDALLEFSDDLFGVILQPLVGVETPVSDDRYVVVGQPDNAPWDSLYADFYIPYVLPLTIMLLSVALAYVGLRAGSMSNYKRKRLLRRIALVFMGTFVWFPLVSIPLQLVNDIGLTLAPIDEMSEGMGGLIKASVGGLFVLVFMVIISNVLLIVAVFVLAVRWLGIVVLTVLMPLLGVLWAMDVWPVSPAAEMARRAAGIYPGLVLAGIPAAALLRIGWQLELTQSATGLFNLFLGLALIPTAVIAAVMTVYWSSPAMKAVAYRGINQTNPATAARAAKTGVGTSVRGARNVHRGYAQNAAGPVTKSGQTMAGSGSSSAYKIGAATRSARAHAGRYNNLRKSRTGKMRTKAKADAGRSAQIATARSKQAFRNTKQKVSRW